MLGKRLTQFFPLSFDQRSQNPEQHFEVVGSNFFWSLFQGIHGIEHFVSSGYLLNVS